MTDSEWPSRSCRSRAKRSRSSATARRASSARASMQLAVGAHDLAHRDHRRADAQQAEHEPAGRARRRRRRRLLATPAIAAVRRHGDDVPRPRQTQARQRRPT